MTDRRRVWITGLGIITACGTGLDAFRAGLRAARSPVKRIDRFDPSPFRSQVAAQVDDFDPLAWMPPKTARQLDRFSQFGLVAGRLALDDAALTPGAGGAADPGRIGIYLGSALGGIAYAEEQHERYLERGIKAVAPNLALAVFGGAAPANLGIALDVRGPILSTANSCASGAVAIGEALGDLREGRVDAAIAGGCEIPLSAARVRCLRHHPGAVGRPQRRAGDGGPAVRRRPRRVRHGRGRRAARSSRRRTWPSDAARSRTRRSSATARRRTPITWSSRGPTGREAARAATIALADGGRRGRCHRLRQRARVVHPDRRRGRGAGDRAGPRGPRRDGAGQRHEGAVRAPARGVRCDRGGDLRAGHPRRLGARLGQPPRAGSGRRRAAPWAACERAATGRTAGSSRRRSGSAA